MQTAEQVQFLGFWGMFWSDCFLFGNGPPGPDLDQKFDFDCKIGFETIEVQIRSLQHACCGMHPDRKVMLPSGVSLVKTLLKLV
eukprot:586457-Amphidinium_carterae.1